MDQNKQSTPQAYAVVRCHAVSQRSADATWQAIGDYGEVGRFLDIACKLEAGTGTIGSIRRIGDAILEAKVGETARSYTYIQTEGPMASYGYHGCLAVEVRDVSTCDIHYTLVFDATTMEAGQKEREIERLSKRFQGAVDAMRADVQGSGETGSRSRP